MIEKRHVKNKGYDPLSHAIACNCMQLQHRYGSSVCKLVIVSGYKF